MQPFASHVRARVKICMHEASNCSAGSCGSVLPELTRAAEHTPSFASVRLSKCRPAQPHRGRPLLGPFLTLFLP